MYYIKVLKKLLGLEDKPLTAVQANKISRYGIYEPFDRTLSRNIQDIELQIKQKLTQSPDEKLLAMIVPPEKIQLFDAIKENFLERGFKAFYVTKEQIEDLGPYVYLFISWDIAVVDKEEKEVSE